MPEDDIVLLEDVEQGVVPLEEERRDPSVLQIPTEDLHSELITALARRGARIREISIVVEERESGSSMYHFWKALLYPAKTFLCILGGRFVEGEGTR